MRERYRLLPCLLMLLLLPCWMLPAEPAVSTSPEPSSGEPMVPLRICEQELTALEEKCVEQVTKLEADCAVRLREAVVGAAADAARPLLATLDVVRAERDAWRVRARTGTALGVAGWLFGAVCLALAVVAHCGQPNPLTMP